MKNFLVCSILLLAFFSNRVQGNIVTLIDIDSITHSITLLLDIFIILSVYLFFKIYNNIKHGYIKQGALKIDQSFCQGYRILTIIIVLMFRARLLRSLIPVLISVKFANGA